MLNLYQQNQNDPTNFYGNAVDIQNAKRAGVEGNFVNTSNWGQNDYMDALSQGGYVLGGPGAEGGVNKSWFQRAVEAGADLNRISGDNRGETYSQLLQYADNPDQKNYYGNAVDISKARNAGIEGDFYNIAELNPSYVADIIANGGVVLGGPGAAVSQEAYRQAVQNGADLQRIGGDNREETFNLLQQYYQQQQTDPVDIDQYRTETATIQDLMEKYGFDFSRENAEQIAEAAAQAKRDAAENKEQQITNNVENAVEGTNQDFFQQFLQQQQAQVNNGLNAGIAANQNLRLQMAQNDALSDVYATAQENRMAVQDALGRIEQEKLAQANQIYYGRLQDAFQNAMALTEQRRTDNLARLQAALQQRGQNIDLSQFTQEMNQEQYQFDNLSAAQQEQAAQFAARLGFDQTQFNNLSAFQKAQLAEEARQFNMTNELNQDQLNLARDRLQEEKRQFDSELAWRKHEYQNMSAYDQARLEQNAEQFGEEMAWRMYEMKQTMNYYNSGFKNTGGGGDIDVPDAPSSYEQDLAQAIERTGMPASQVPYFNWIISHESSFSPTADNPTSTAYGYGQFLDSTRDDYTSRYNMPYIGHPVNQLVLTYHYMVNRYGSPQGAVEFWKANHWY